MVGLQIYSLIFPPSTHSSAYEFLVSMQVPCVSRPIVKSPPIGPSESKQGIGDLQNFPSEERSSPAEHTQSSSRVQDFPVSQEHFQV